MRVLKQSFEPDGSGVISVEPEEVEDLWNLYNLISKNDCVTAAAIRKVQRTNALGSVSTESKHTIVTFIVTTCDFDNVAGTLRISGRICEQNPYVQLGAYHTVTIKPTMRVTLFKSYWDFIAKEKLREALEPRRSAEVAVVIWASATCSS